MAYGIVALLPVELILHVGSRTGFAMVFALLIGAIIWNLGTSISMGGCSDGEDANELKDEHCSPQGEASL